MIRAADSVGANLVEGDGRYSDADALNFFVVARASARETRYWVSLARDRNLVTTDEADALDCRLNDATKRLNMLIRHRRATKNIGQVREDEPTYDA
jgi:four helix bundle protein